MPLSRVHWRISNGETGDVLAAGHGLKPFRRDVVNLMLEQTAARKAGLLIVSWEPRLLDEQPERT